MNEPRVTIINSLVYTNSITEKKHWAYLTPREDNATTCMLPNFESYFRQAVKEVYFKTARDYMTMRDKWCRIRRSRESSKQDAALAKIYNDLRRMGLQFQGMWTGQSTLLMLLAQREMESCGERDFPESMMQLITGAYAATGPEGIEEIATWMTKFQRLYAKARNAQARNAQARNAEAENKKAENAKQENCKLWDYFCKDTDQPTEIWRNWRLQLSQIYFANRLILSLDDTILQTRKRTERLESKLFSEYKGGNLTSPEGKLLVSSVSNAQMDLMDLIFRRRLLQRRTANEFPGGGFPILDETSLTQYLEEDIGMRKQSPDHNSDRLWKNWLKSLLQLKDYNIICRGYLWHTLRFTSEMTAETFVICQYLEQHLLQATMAPPWMDSTLVENTRRFLQCLKRYVRTVESANREIKVPSIVYRWPPSTMVNDMTPTPAGQGEVSKISGCRPKVDIEAEKCYEIESVGMTTGEDFLAEVGPSLGQELIHPMSNKDPTKPTPATPDPLPNVISSSKQGLPQLACKPFQNSAAAVSSHATDLMVSAGMGLCLPKAGSEVAKAEPSTGISISGQFEKHPESEAVSRIDENLQSLCVPNVSHRNRGKKRELVEQETLTCLTMAEVSGQMEGEQQQQQSKQLASDSNGSGNKHQVISRNSPPSKVSSHTVDTKQLHPQRNHRKKAKAVKRQPFQFTLKSKDELAGSPPQKGSMAKQSPSPPGIGTSETRARARKPPAKQLTEGLLDKTPQAVKKDRRAPTPKKAKRSEPNALSKNIPLTNAAIIEKPNSIDEIAIKKGAKYPTRAHNNRGKAAEESNSRLVIFSLPAALPEAKQETIEVISRDIKPQNALNSGQITSPVMSAQGSTPLRNPHAILESVGTKADGQAVQKMELLPVSKSEHAIDNPKNSPSKKQQAPVYRQHPASPANLEPIERENPRTAARHQVDMGLEEKTIEKNIVDEGVRQPILQEIQPEDFHDLKNFPALTRRGLDTADERQAQSSGFWKQWTRSASANRKPESVNVRITQDLTTTVNTSEEENSMNEPQLIPTCHEQGKKSDPSTDAQDHEGGQIQGANIETSQKTKPEYKTIKPSQGVQSESKDYTNQDGLMFEENYQEVNGVSKILKDLSAQSHDFGLEPLPAPKRSQAGFAEDTNIMDALSIRSLANTSNPLEHLINKDVPDPRGIPKPHEGPLLPLPLQQYSWPPPAVRYLELLSPKISTKSYTRKQHYSPITQPLVAKIPKNWKASKLPECPSTISVARKLQELSPGAEHGAHGILPVGYGRNQRSWHEQPADISRSAYLGPISDEIPPIDPFWKQLPSRPSHYPWFIHRSKAEASQVTRNTLANQTSDGISDGGNCSGSDFSLDSGNQSQHGLETIPETKTVLLKETKAFENAISRWSKQVGTFRIIERYRPEVLSPSRLPNVSDEITPQSENYLRDNPLAGPPNIAENWPAGNARGPIPIATSEPLSSTNDSYGRRAGDLADLAAPKPLYPANNLSMIDDNTS